MPVHFNDLLDDPLLFDAQESFIGGQLSNFRANLLSPAQGLLLQNVDVESNGTLRTRRGFRRFLTGGSALGAGDVQGIHWFSTPTASYLAAAMGGDVYVIDSSGDYSIYHPGAVPTTGDVWFSQVGNRLFAGAMEGGLPRLVQWDSSTFATPGSQTACTDGPVRIAYLTSQKWRIFGYDPDSADSVYCSTYLPTDPTPFTAASAIEPFRVGEGEGEPITGLFPWKGFNLIVFKASSVWSVDTTPAPNNATDATTTSLFTINRISGRVGCMAHRSAAMCGNDVLFLARDGVRSLARTQADGDGAVSDPLSLPVDDYVQRINWAAADTSCATFWNGRYLLAVPLDSAETPDTILVYRPQTGAWFVWTGLQPVQFVVTRFTNQPQKLMMLDARGDVLEFRDYLPFTTATGTDFKDAALSSEARVSWRIKSRGFTFNEPLNAKQPEFIEMEFDRSNAIIQARVEVDGENVDPLAQWLETGDSGLVLPFVLPAVLGESKVKRVRLSMREYQPCRELVIDLAESDLLDTTDRTTSEFVALRSIRLAGFLNSFETFDRVPTAPSPPATQGAFDDGFDGGFA